jgi:hypothetical protein
MAELSAMGCARWQAAQQALAYNRPLAQSLQSKSE